MKKKGQVAKQLIKEGTKMSLEQIQLSVPQEIFLVAFSILYGIMLQTYFGLNPFPWGKILDRSKKSTQLDEEQILNIRKRLLTSLIVLSIIPFCYAVFILWILGFKCFLFTEWKLESYIIVFFSFWSGLAVFGFQRFYGWIAIKKPKIFWRNHKGIIVNLVEEKTQKKILKFTEKLKKGTQPNSRASLVSTIFYIGLPITTLILSSVEIVYGLILWVIIISIFLLWLMN